ncbi:hypothetical protein [Actinomadura rugatobispora]|uniref:Uncharacterized protein n=1 Tax=Actinomadura rugatobispora TaxID=1994 RepID=A0ABW0ZTT3_9ACTN|nr:hypothetical protein GCM10010200_058370 [Actinomadura rugatobispora]
MSDEGERGGRWTEMSDNSAGREENVRVTVPEVEVPEPEGRTDFSGPALAPERAEADDVKVAPVPKAFDDAKGLESAQGSDDELFGGEGDPQYAGVTTMGPATPPKPGKPSSGNWQMPDWMADEDAADAKLGRSSGGFDGQPRGRGGEGLGDGGEGRNKLVLYGGVGLLVVALLAAGGVYLLKQRGGDSGAGEVRPGRAASDSRPQPPQVQMPAAKPLKRFAGRPSRLLGMVSDRTSGLAYPRLARPWQPPTKANKLATPGWSGQQVLVTERRGTQVWYGQLLTGTLNPNLHSAYTGAESVPGVAVLAHKGIEAQYYDFPHRTAPLASQALTVDGRKGWLVASYLTYKRAGVRATGEVVVTAVVDTGRPAPAVAFVSVPNTHKKMWPDVNQFLTRLKIAS